MHPYTRNPTLGASPAASDFTDWIGPSTNTDEAATADPPEAAQTLPQERVVTNPGPSAEPEHAESVEPPQWDPAKARSTRLFAYLKLPDLDNYSLAPFLYTLRYDLDMPRLEQVKPAEHRATFRDGRPVSFDAYELRVIPPELSSYPAQLASMTSNGTAYEQDDDGHDNTLSKKQKRNVREKDAVFVRFVSLGVTPAPTVDRSAQTDRGPGYTPAGPSS